MFRRWKACDAAVSHVKQLQLLLWCTRSNTWSPLPSNRRH